MTNPVAQTVTDDLALSTVDTVIPTVSTDDVSQSSTVPDSPGQSDEVRHETDPVTVAVETAVQQWIGFDPAIHATNPDGTPRLRKDGSYAHKRGRGGRKSVADGTAGDADLFADDAGNSPASVPGVSRETTAPTPTPATAPNLNTNQAATMLVIAGTTMMSKLVGPEWAAEKPEQKALIDATKIYLDSKGGLNVTPEMGLCIALCMYAVPRVAHENTRSKFGRAVDWVRDRFTVLRARFNRG